MSDKEATFDYKSVNNWLFYIFYIYGITSLLKIRVSSYHKQRNKISKRPSVIDKNIIHCNKQIKLLALFD